MAQATSYNIKFEPSFSGNINDDARAWLEEFEYYRKVTKLDEDMSRRLFALKLSGVARKWLNSVADFEKAKIEDLITKFRAAFVDIDAKESVRMALYTRVFKPEKETVMQYVFEVGALCESLGDNLTEAQKLQYVIRGLPSQWCNSIHVSSVATIAELIAMIRKFRLDETGFKPNVCSVQGNTPTNLREVGGLAAAVCSVENNDKILVSRAELSGMIEEAVKRVLKPTRSCSHCKRTGHEESHCWIKHGKPTSFSQKNSQSQVIGSPKVMSSQDKIKFRTYKCHNCGKMGHIKVFCRNTVNVPLN